MRSLVILAVVTAYAAGSLTLSEAIQLNPGRVTRDQLTRTFGKPDNIVKFKDPPARETWEYSRDGIIKLAVFFDEGSETANSWDWGIGSSDPEKNLKAAKARFPNATWSVETTRWINPHAAPYECYYKDEKLGVSLEFNLVRREVFGIHRWNPERKLASEENEKPPVYCLGREPNTGCSPAIPAKEFFKDMSVAEYCDKVH